MNIEVYSPPECHVCHDRANIYLTGQYWCGQCLEAEIIRLRKSEESRTGEPAPGSILAKSNA